MDRKNATSCALLALWGCTGGDAGPSAETPILSEVATAPFASVPKGSAVYADDWRSFATYCDPNYEGEWQKTLTGTWELCSGFARDLAQTSSELGYYNLSNAKDAFEDSCDHCGGGGVELADLIFHAGHGGAFSEESGRRVGAPRHDRDVHDVEPKSARLLCQHAARR
jgi:hypothetical protein